VIFFYFIANTVYTVYIDMISKQRYAVFGHVTTSINSSQSGSEAPGRFVTLQICTMCRLEALSWSSAPHGWWVDQLRQDNHSPADLWRSTINRGHYEVTLWFRLTTC